LFNHKYSSNALVQDLDINKMLLKDKDKLDIVIKNSLNGIDTDTLLSAPDEHRTSNVAKIITEINFLLE